MPESRTCEECGAELPLNAPEGLCPRCLVGMGLSLASPAQPTRVLVEPQTGNRIGHYKLLQQIGEGGCGLVYMAEQEEPVRRRVALKVIKLKWPSRENLFFTETERHICKKLTKLITIKSRLSATPDGPATSKVRATASVDR
jgi:hypothetical protein